MRELALRSPGNLAQSVKVPKPARTRPGTMRLARRAIASIFVSCPLLLEGVFASLGTGVRGRSSRRKGAVE